MPALGGILKIPCVSGKYIHTQKDWREWSMSTFLLQLIPLPKWHPSPLSRCLRGLRGLQRDKGDGKAVLHSTELQKEPQNLASHLLHFMSSTKGKIFRVTNLMLERSPWAGCGVTHACGRCTYTALCCTKLEWPSYINLSDFLINRWHFRHNNWIPYGLCYKSCGFVLTFAFKQINDQNDINNKPILFSVLLTG